jgi:hypothetical protein
MSPIQEAIEYIESREAGDKFSYRQVAKELGLIEQRCREGTKAKHGPMKRWQNASSYSTHNKSMNLCYT